MQEGLLVNLGFMANSKPISEIAEIAQNTIFLLRTKLQAKFRVVVLLSDPEEKSAIDLSPFHKLDCPFEVIVLFPRKIISGERHRLFGSGFIEGADVSVICDLDFGYTPEVIAEGVFQSFDRQSLVVIPQPTLSFDGGMDVGALAHAFENYVVCRITGQNRLNLSGSGYPNLQTGLSVFRQEAVRELLKRPWIFRCVLWDLEVAFFVLSSSGMRVIYPKIEFTISKFRFNPVEAILKLRTVSGLSGSLASQQAQAHFEDFIKICARFLHADTVDKYREQVLSKL